MDRPRPIRHRIRKESETLARDFTALEFTPESFDAVVSHGSWRRDEPHAFGAANPSWHAQRLRMTPEPNSSYSLLEDA
jgi:hypothetical protein